MVCFIVEVRNFWVTDPIHRLKHENENTGGVDSVVRSSLELKIVLKLFCHAVIIDLIFVIEFNVVGHSHPMNILCNSKIDMIFGLPN